METRLSIVLLRHSSKKGEYFTLLENTCLICIKRVNEIMSDSLEELRWKARARKSTQATQAAVADMEIQRLLKEYSASLRHLCAYRST